MTVIWGSKTLTGEDKKIADIILVNQKGKSAKTIPEKIVKAQILKIDTASGATTSSMMILKSIENTLISDKS